MADPDVVARMMADLGLARRDVVSAPDADSRGRHTNDAYAQRNTLSEFEARQRYIIENAPAENAKAAKLQAWNTTKTFERDEVSEQLENRYSGQGHRAALNQAMRGGHIYDRQWEATEARFGEERRIHLQERAAAGGGNYVTSAAPAPQRRPDDRTPRSFSGGQQQTRHADRGRATPPRAQNPNRAPSPRSFGTVRFGPGGQRAGQPGPTAARQPGPRPVPTPPANAPTGPRTQAGPAPPRPQPNGIPPQHQRPAATAPEPATTLLSSTNQSSTTGHTPTQEAQYSRMAELYAAEPGPECDAYHKKFPDRLQYLAPALRRLIKKCFVLAQDPYGRDVSDYLAAHKNREWIWEAALQAKGFVENHIVEEAEAYYAAHPQFVEFYKGAKKNFKPKPQATPFQPSGNGTPAPAATSEAPAPAPAPAAAAAASSSQAQPSASAASSTSAPRERLPTPASTANVKAPAAPKPSTEQPPQAAPKKKLPGTFPSDEETSPSNRVAPPQPNVNTNTSSAVTQPAPKKKLLGTLSAVFRDMAGKFLDEQTWPIAPPVHLDMNINSVQRGFDTCQLMSEVSTFAKSLEARAQGSVAFAVQCRDGKGVGKSKKEDKENEDPAMASFEAGIKRMGDMVQGEDGIWEEPE